MVRLGFYEFLNVLCMNFLNMVPKHTDRECEWERICVFWVCAYNITHICALIQRIMADIYKYVSCERQVLYHQDVVLYGIKKMNGALVCLLIHWNTHTHTHTRIYLTIQHFNVIDLLWHKWKSHRYGFYIYVRNFINQSKSFIVLNNFSPSVCIWIS